ncbi:unnamed protein product [Vicia faba]|uniref:Uncharacterized protein n=1 Tax=Vicia faba TaxID=3906 RepID=A0AAV1B2R3_VICFA|nr:unnamed protein product [Vicia faba]
MVASQDALFCFDVFPVGLELMECLLHHVVYGARLETSVYGLTLEIYAWGYRILEAKTCSAPQFSYGFGCDYILSLFCGGGDYYFLFPLTAFCN